VRCDGGRCKAELDKTELSTRELEKMVKEKEWMIADLENTHRYKITDLETQMENLKKAGQKLQEDFQRKHAALDRLVREKEEMLTNAKQVRTDFVKLCIILSGRALKTDQSNVFYRSSSFVNMFHIF
jgi:ABC-type phosphate transport system auxiliary subunit